MESTTTEKLRELILYIARRSEGDPHFGKTKLNEILFYADFGSFSRKRQSITGQGYQKWPYGPVPTDIVDSLDAMCRDGDLVLARREHYGFQQQCPLALREPDLSLFSGDEIAILEQVLAELRPLTGRDVSDLSHHFIGWRAAADEELIPYETVFLDNSPATDDEEAYAVSLIAAGR